MAQSIFIDGESGTTGLEIFSRLKERPDLHILRLDAEHRKNPAARADALNACDLAILCLPDAAAIEAVSLIENTTTRVLDASTAHRINPGWAYGFAEMTQAQAGRIAEARRVANPGCYATGAIAILRPLIDAGVLSPSYPVTLNAVSGYTGGGKTMIAAFEAPAPGNRIDNGFFEYGLGFDHKHLPEIRVHAGLSAPPLFIPSVGRFPRGMLVNLPLRLSALTGGPTGADLHAIYTGHFPAGGQVRVRPPLEEARDARIAADELANTDWMDIHVIASDTADQLLIVASLDNLGKGACGAAIQNIGLMLGIAGLSDQE